MSETVDPFGTKPGCENKSPIPNITAEELGNHIVIIRKSLNEIHTALVGNKLGTEGVIPRLAKVETVQAEHSRRFVVWGSILSAAGTLLVFLKDYFIKPPQ